MGKNKKKKNISEEPVPEEKCFIQDESAENFFEDAPPSDEKNSFYEMNLSRPLMKVRRLLLAIRQTVCREIYSDV